MADEQTLIEERRRKLAALRERGEAFPNDFRRDALAGELHSAYADRDAAALEAEPVRVRVAGRIVAKRVMGKVSFLQLQDMSGRIQVLLQRDVLGDEPYRELRKGLDVGDIVGVEGTLIRTRTGELTVRAERVRLLTKALRPLPEKWHGLQDQERRYRQRYVDLIVNPEVRRVFITRTRVIAYIRRFLDERGFVEVETPMMQPIPGGATARPFVTHHNALDMDLYLRIAPELYLKRLVVGGFEKVYEINRNFRNEGLSSRHNPEFTMLEFYWAYADYRDLMDLTEEMLQGLAREVLGSTTVRYQGRDYDLGRPFRRVRLLDAILERNPGVEAGALRETEGARRVAERLGVPVEESWGPGKIQLEIFEKTVEETLLDPTFVTHFPTEVSPLARRSAEDPFYTDRFELFVAGREIANGFSELNDYEDQAERFREQARQRAAGDDEAMYYDADFIRALEHGMPPTAGEGIGIDRLVMFLTDSPSIRDVILFPHMRPER
ncbi:MAG TPA: lysine--tRNA ligase [Chromatiales bacterium]|nr:lysine--tRNA ligase [Chromatiales bacterium]